MTTVENAGYYRVQWKGDLTDAPSTVKRYGSVRFRPMAVDIHYILEPVGWMPHDIVITGPQIKKDGTDGQTLITSEYNLSWMDDAPQWLLDLAHANAPASVA